VGHYIPQLRRGNEFFEASLDTTDAWIVARTGIRERRIAGADEAASDLVVAAARGCLAEAGVDIDAIDGIIVSTTTPDYRTPPTAAVVQSKLGGRRPWGLDISAACAGFVYGLSIATSMIESGAAERILLCSGEKMTMIADPSDRTTIVLFGDGGGAVLVERTDDPSLAVLRSVLALDSTGIGNIVIPGGGSRLPGDCETYLDGAHYLKLNGPAVFRAAVEGLSRVTREALEGAGLGADDIRMFVPHQANMRIIDAVAAELDMNPDKVYKNVDRFGNTASASIPICLSELHAEGNLLPGDVIVVAAFGAGYTLGASVFRWGIPPRGIA
jgi:3-oxoacyl-[acyl-carrier-protein] synthase-3